jgi:hypothetical protein
MPFSLPRRRTNAPTIFISYRRDDSSGYAGRLHDALRDVLGDANVRMDVDDFAAGGEFAVEAKEMAGGSDVLLALMGSRWAEGANAARLADPADLLRQEIETALEKGVRVIPVLLNGARLPDAAALPDSLQPLLHRNAFDLSERRWDYDVNDMVAALRSTPARAGAGGGGRPGGRPWKLALAAAVLAAVVIAGTMYLRQPSPTDAKGAFGIDHRRFLASYQREFGPLQPETRSGIDGLLYLVDEDSSLADLRQAAYILATIKHETADTWLPYEEPGRGSGRPYGNTVVVTDPQGKRYRNQYYGRGYVLLTWQANYEQFGKRLKMDRLIYEPDLAMEPTVAYAVLSLLMREGVVAGAPLRRYINPTRCDYVNARRTVDGTSQAEQIAGYAVRLEKILRESTPAQPPAFVVITPSLYVRPAPGTSSPVTGEPPQHGTVVSQLERRGEWTRIAVSGARLTGWVPGSFLRPATAAEALGPPCSATAARTAR